MTHPSRRSRRRGFTLIEVLLVLVILVVLASTALIAIGPIQNSANMRMAKTQIGAFHTPLETYRLDMGDYPTTAQGLQALRTPPQDVGGGGRWMGPYLGKDIPPDPWGRPYQYEYPGRMDPLMPDIWSMGRDGVSGTEDDITSWQ
jgi:general secretion pathway protein G